MVARDGRFGVYVTDGTNASIGKGHRIEEISPERAFELLAIRREQGLPRSALEEGLRRNRQRKPLEEDNCKEINCEEIRTAT